MSHTVAICTYHILVSPCCLSLSHSGRSGRVSQDPISDGFAALNEQTQVPPPFKIEINYGKTKEGYKEDREEGGKAKLANSMRFMSRLRVETSFDKEDDVYCEGRYETEDSGREHYKNRSTEYSRAPRDLKTGTHTHTASGSVSVRHMHPASTVADRASLSFSPRPVLSLPKFSRQVLSAPLFRPVIATNQMASPSLISPAGQSTSCNRLNEYSVLNDSQTERGDDRDRDRERGKDVAWMAPRSSKGTSNSNSISKTQHTGGPYSSSVIGIDHRDCASDSDILVS